MNINKPLFILESVLDKSCDDWLIGLRIFEDDEINR